MTAHDHSERELVPLITKMASAVERLVSDHLMLARLELVEDARVLARRAALIGACVPFALVGWALLSAAIAVFLAPALGLAWALLGVGGLGLAGAALAAFIITRGTKRHVLMDDTSAVLARTARAIGTAVSEEPAGVARN